MLKVVTRPVLVQAECEHTGYATRKWKDTRWWEVRDPAGELVRLTVYRRGARELGRLAA